MNTKKTRYLDFFNPAPFEKKAALLFELMGYEVEHNRRFADYQVEIFIKKKVSFCSDYESWICLINKGNQKVGKKAVDHLFHILEVGRKELEKESERYSDCQAMYISKTGFTSGAIKTAKAKLIELVTPYKLFKLLEDYTKRRETANEAGENFLLYILCMNRLCSEGRNR